MESTREFEERRRLEVEFIQALDQVVAELISSDFSEEDINIFTNTVKTFMRFDDLKQFIIDLIYDKIILMFRIIKPSDADKLFAFRKFIRIILDLQEPELIEALETYLVANKHSDYFLFFLEEQFNKRMNTSHAEKSFIDLIYTNETSLKDINRFLSIVKKNKKDLIKELLSNKDARRYNGLRRVIDEVIKNEPEALGEHIVPGIVEYYDGDAEDYMRVVADIVTATNNFTKDLLSKKQANSFDYVTKFWSFIIGWHSHNTALVKNFATFLYNEYANLAIEFEDEFINIADPNYIIDFAVQVPFSNKRKILRKLIALKDDKWLVHFIKKFPEYKSLLPML